jgi:hypothetical protein
MAVLMLWGRCFSVFEVGMVSFTVVSWWGNELVVRVGNTISVLNLFPHHGHHGAYVTTLGS